MNISLKKIHNVEQALVVCLFLAVVLSCVMPTISYAQTYNPSRNTKPVQYTLLEPLPCINNNSEGCTNGTQVSKVKFSNYIQYIFNLFVALAAVTAVFMIVYGGFKYVTTDSFSDKNEGKDLIWNAIKGLILVLCSYLILRTIDPRLVNIPSNIVKPLDINISRNLVSSFLNQLALTTVDHSGITEENKAVAKEIINNGIQEVTGLQERLTQLTADYNAAINSRDDERASMIAAEIEAVKNNIQKVNSRVTTQTNTVGMMSAVSAPSLNASPGGIPTVKSINDSVALVNDLYDAGLNQLKYVSNPPDQEQQKLLEDEKNFALGLLAMQKASADASGLTASAAWEAAKAGASFAKNIALNPGSVRSNLTGAMNTIKTGVVEGSNATFIAEVNSNVKSYADKISNPDLKNQLMQIVHDVTGSP